MWKVSLVLPLALVAVCSALTLPAVKTNTRQSFSVNCPRGKYITKLESRYDSATNDRVWDITCGGEGLTGSCRNTQWSNGYNQAMFVMCNHPGAVLAGIKSQYKANKKDRRYAFRCCKSPNKVVKMCRKTTDWANEFNGPMDRPMHKGWAFRGAFSMYDAEKTDRKFRFYFCKMQPGP